MLYVCVVFCFFKQKTAYEMRISDWSSDVCSSDLLPWRRYKCSQSYKCSAKGDSMLSSLPPREREIVDILYERGASTVSEVGAVLSDALPGSAIRAMLKRLEAKGFVARTASARGFLYAPSVEGKRSEEHTSELQSLM